MAEFEAVVDRTHAAGMKVLIDLVPNHVARSYGSVVHPEKDFGAGDDKTKFFDKDNSFFYLVDPPGQALGLSKPGNWNPSGVTFDGAFALEDGAAGHVPRATGNNVTSPTPGATDWYETVKLNYGFNFADPAASKYDPIPKTWERIDDILAYWQSKGVDGFRCDFAHYVPTEAWGWILEQAKKRNPDVFFMAEAYENLTGLLGAGFDAVYNDAPYDTLKRIYQGKAGLSDLDTELGKFDDPVRGLYVHYLENHDERRIASPINADGGADDTGFGSAKAGKQLAPLMMLYSDGPVLFYNGQEVGEQGAGVEGFGGDDGRTTIFDYWSMPAFTKWVNDGKYDGGGLDADQKSLRAYYKDLLALCQSPEVRGHRYWGLSYVNNAGAHPDAPASIFTFGRFSTAGESLVIVVANFGPGMNAKGPIRIADDLATEAGLPAEGDLEVVRILDENGKSNEVVGTATRTSLVDNGFIVDVPDQSTHVFRIHKK
jgi:glycosidase